MNNGGNGTNTVSFNVTPVERKFKTKWSVTLLTGNKFVEDEIVEQSEE
jgi:hypothetical protein